MDVALSSEQEALQEAVRDYCAHRAGVDVLRGLDADGTGFGREIWEGLAELGVFSLRMPEDDGGAGLGWTETVLVNEELGRALVPGPLIWTQLGADVIEGASVIGGIDRTGDNASAPLFVEHLDELDTLVVLSDDNVTLHDPEAVEATRVATPLDPLSPVHHVTSLGTGAPLGDADLAAAWRRRGTALVAALSLGIGEAALDLAVAYSKDHEQFGVPIGSFQAVKHMCADMLVRVEVARAAVHTAGALLDDPDAGDLDLSLSAARICAGRAAHANTKTCVQVHGGMGYTWEVPVHYHLKRAWLLDTLFGSGEEHADAVAATLVPA